MSQSGFNCRVRSYSIPKSSRFHFDRFVHLVKWHSFNIAVAIVFLVWLARAVWHEAGVSELLPSAFAGQKANTATISDPALQSCKVTISDLDGIEHTAHVSATTFYEAIALAIRAIKGAEWAGKIPEGTTAIVCAQKPEVEHKVTIGVLNKWLSQSGESPSDKIARAKARAILQPVAPL